MVLPPYHPRKMAPTRDFRESIVERAQEDAEFRVSLLRRSVECILGGEMEVGKWMMRSYIEAAGGFDALGAEMNKPPKSVSRMFSASGNPSLANLSLILACMQKREGVRFSLREDDSAPARKRAA